MLFPSEYRLNMNQSNLQKVIDSWKKGNETPFNNYYCRLYRKTMPKLKKLTVSGAEAEDIFMEGVFTFLKKFFYEGQQVPKNVEGYFYRICYNIWFDLQHQRKKNRFEATQKDQRPNQGGYAIEEESFLEYARTVAFGRGVEKLKGNCKKIFEAHVEEGRKLKDLWGIMGYPSYQSLIQAFYRCKKKLTMLVFEELQQANTTNSLK